LFEHGFQDLNPVSQLRGFPVGLCVPTLHVLPLTFLLGSSPRAFRVTCLLLGFASGGPLPSFPFRLAIRARHLAPDSPNSHVTPTVVPDRGKTSLQPCTSPDCVRRGAIASYTRPRPTHALALAVNRILGNAVLLCGKGADRIYGYFEVGILGFWKTVGPILHGSNWSQPEQVNQHDEQHAEHE
jgi:hypothetical protein